MENASKAIIIAGAILIAVALMSLLLVFFNSYREFNANAERRRDSEEARTFNRFFEQSNYDVDKTTSGTQIYGYDVYNIALKACELSRTFDSDFIMVYIDNTSLHTEDGDTRAVMSNLASFNLSYEGLQYIDTVYGGVDHYDPTAETHGYATSGEAEAADIARRTSKDAFRATYTISKINYSSIDGKINEIRINR